MECRLHLLTQGRSLFKSNRFLGVRYIVSRRYSRYSNIRSPLNLAVFIIEYVIAVALAPSCVSKNIQFFRPITTWRTARSGPVKIYAHKNIHLPCLRTYLHFCNKKCSFSLFFSIFRAFSMLFSSKHNQVSLVIYTSKV